MTRFLREYVCTALGCHRSFYSEEDLEEHLYAWQHFECTCCLQQLPTWFALQEHLRETRHKQASFRLAPRQVQALQVHQADEKKTYLLPPPPSPHHAVYRPPALRHIHDEGQALKDAAADYIRRKQCQALSGIRAMRAV